MGLAERLRYDAAMASGDIGAGWVPYAPAVNKLIEDGFQKKEKRVAHLSRSAPTDERRSKSTLSASLIL